VLRHSVLNRVCCVASKSMVSRFMGTAAAGVGVTARSLTHWSAAGDGVAGGRRSSLSCSCRFTNSRTKEITSRARCRRGPYPALFAHPPQPPQSRRVARHRRPDRHSSWRGLHVHHDNRRITILRLIAITVLSFLCKCGLFDEVTVSAAPHIEGEAGRG